MGIIYLGTQLLPPSLPFYLSLFWVKRVSVCQKYERDLNTPSPLTDRLTELRTASSSYVDIISGEHNFSPSLTFYIYCICWIKASKSQDHRRLKENYPSNNWHIHTLETRILFIWVFYIRGAQLLPSLANSNLIKKRQKSVRVSKV